MTKSLIKMSLSFPKKIKGVIFTEIIHQFLPEIKANKLVELGAIVRKKQRTQIYEPLTDALRKIQWVKLIGLKAIAIEEEIEKEMEPNILVMHPLGQTAHALCVTDCLIHTKSALDSMAVFLTDLLDLDAKGGDRDLKKPRFRKILSEKDQFLKKKIRKLRHWFRELQEVRDEWIHRSSIRCAIIHGPSEVGILPIPKKITIGFSEQTKLTISKENYWSTKDFVEYQYSNLLTFFLALIERCIQIERRDLEEPIPIPADAEKHMTIFPTRLTRSMTVKGIRVKFPKSIVEW